MLVEMCSQGTIDIGVRWPMTVSERYERAAHLRRESRVITRRAGTATGLDDNPERDADVETYERLANRSAVANKSAAPESSNPVLFSGTVADDRETGQGFDRRQTSLT